MSDSAADSMSTFSGLHAEAVATLAHAGVPDPQVDADLLIGWVWGMSRGEVEAKVVTGSSIPGTPVDALPRFRSLVARRATREPLQHILGVAWFRSLELRVGPGVFVPRPETELLAEYAVEALRAQATPEPIGVDLGTGSGAIAIAMATEVPHARIFAVEKSVDAVPWTKQNIAAYGDCVTLVEGDLATALGQLEGRASVVASNPPYIPNAAVPRDPEVQFFDPAMALYGGDDGLDIVRVISKRALDLLHPGGLLIMEHGEVQGDDIRAILEHDGWRSPQTLPDLTHRPRYTRATRP